MSEPRPRHTARVIGDRVEVLFDVPLTPTPPPPPDGPAAGAASPAKPHGITPTHSPDFSAVRWHDGEVYTFSGCQRDIVAVLWHAWEKGFDWVPSEKLLEAAESNSPRVRDLFKKHPAWKSMIVGGHTIGGPVGSYRLSERPAE